MSRLRSLVLASACLASVCLGAATPTLAGLADE